MQKLSKKELEELICDVRFLTRITLPSLLGDKPVLLRTMSALIELENYRNQLFIGEEE